MTLSQWTTLCLCGLLAWGQPSARPPMVPPKVDAHATGGAAINAHPEPHPDITAIVQQSLQRELMNARLLDNYVYEAKEATTTYDVAGHPTKSESKVTEYLWVDGSRYKRIVEENGKPLSPLPLMCLAPFIKKARRTNPHFEALAIRAFRCASLAK